MNGSRRPRVAAEGIPYLLLLGAVTAAVFIAAGAIPAMLPLVLFFCALVIFHDPGHPTPAAPLSVLSPVDGKVVQVGLTEDGAPEGRTHRIVVRVNTFGTYTARCPVEGKIMDLHNDNSDGLLGVHDGGLWLRTDEGADVVLKFTGNRFGLPPRSLVRYGERVGQGHPCAYLRLTRDAEVQVPAGSRILVTPGQRVSSGLDALAKLPPLVPE